MGESAGRADRSHRHSAALLRRWLAETHTPVVTGPLQLSVGTVRLRTEVVYHSATGVHGFGPIRVVDSAGRAEVPAAPELLAAACSAEARARAVPPSTEERQFPALSTASVLRSVTGLPADPVGTELDGIRTRAEATRWVDRYVTQEVAPALQAWCGDLEQATAPLLSRRCLAVVGALGHRGVVEEEHLLKVLARRLEEFDEPNAVVRHWLTSPTLTDYAVLNGRCDGTGGGPEPFEVPNPLAGQPPEVPGVPVPALEPPWSLRPVQVTMDDEADVTLVQRWMNREHVAKHWEQAWSWARWRTELAKQLVGDHSLPCVVSHHGRPVAYVELYRVVRDTLGRCYPYEPHDLGVHIAIGQPEATGRGLGSALLRTVAEGLLAVDPLCKRVVAEPNVHNAASVGAFRKAGYVRQREVRLPTKNSALMVFSRPEQGALAVEAELGCGRWQAEA